MYAYPDDKHTRYIAKRYLLVIYDQLYKYVTHRNDFKDSWDRKFTFRSEVVNCAVDILMKSKDKSRISRYLSVVIALKKVLDYDYYCPYEIMRVVQYYNKTKRYTHAKLFTMEFKLFMAYLK